MALPVPPVLRVLLVRLYRVSQVTGVKRETQARPVLGVSKESRVL